MDSIFSQYLMQLLAQVPVLIAYVAGIIAVLAFWQRCPRPAMFTLIGTALLLVTTLAQPFLIVYLLMQLRQRLGMDVMNLLMAVNTIFWGAIRAAAYGLLLTAVFVNRKEPPPLPSSTAAVFQ